VTTVTIAPVDAGCVIHPALRLAERVLHECSTIPGPDQWVTSYGDYQSGGWQTLSLINATGDPADVTISGNTAPVRISLLQRMPATTALLDELGLDVWWARLAMMQPDSYLWEHRDYTEPGIANHEQYRLHLPLITSKAAYFVTAGHALHMTADGLWRINPTTAHGAVNLSGPPRLHLILDCRDSPVLDQFRAAEVLPQTSLRPLPPATPEELDQAARDAVDPSSKPSDFGQDRPLELWIIQTKTTPGFTETGIDKLENSIRRLLDLSQPLDTLGVLYNELRTTS